MSRRLAGVLLLLVLNACASRDAPKSTDTGVNASDTGQEQEDSSTAEDTLVPPLDTSLPDTQITSD